MEIDTWERIYWEVSGKNVTFSISWENCSICGADDRVLIKENVQNKKSDGNRLKKKCTNNAAIFKEIIIINNNSVKLYDFLQLIP